jgi:hypothetical protein
VPSEELRRAFTCQQESPQGGCFRIQDALPFFARPGEQNQDALARDPQGKAIADVFPPAVEQTGHSWIGSMEGVIPITGDIVSRVVDLDDFERLKD